MVLYNIVQNSRVQYSTVQYSIVQYSTSHYISLQSGAGLEKAELRTIKK